MDVMLDDFLNPRQTAPIKEQNSRVIQDSAISIEPPQTSTLPQASSPSLPAHVPLVEDYPYSDSTYQYSTPQTIPSQSVTTPQYSQTQPAYTQPVQPQYQYIAPEPVYTQPNQQYQYSQTDPAYTQQQYQYTQTQPAQQQYQYTQTQPAQQQYQYTQTQPAYTQPAQPQTQYAQTEPVYTQPVQTVQTETAAPQSNNSQTAAAEADESAEDTEDIDDIDADEEFAEIDDSGTTDIIFTEDMLEEDYFEKVMTLTGNIEYNSYNSKFRTLGLSMMLDYSLRQNASIGVLAGGFIDFSKGFKIKGISFSQDIFEAELALFYRHYIMTDSQKAARPFGHGFYLQPELGVAVAFNKTGLIKDQLGLKVSPLGALRMGYRLYIRKSPLYFEPYVRLGYPFIAGGGLAFGWQL